MLVVEKDVVPQVVEAGFGICRAGKDVGQGMQHFGGDGPLFGAPAKGRFQGARGGAIFPPSAEVGLQDGNLAGEVLFDIAEEILRPAEDELGILPFGVPFLDDFGQPGGDSLVIAEGPVDEHGVIGVFRFS